MTPTPEGMDGMTEEKLLTLWRNFLKAIQEGKIPANAHLMLYVDGSGAVWTSEVLERGLTLDGSRALKYRESEQATIYQDALWINDPPYYRDGIKKIGMVHPKKASKA